MAKKLTKQFKVEAKGKEVDLCMTVTVKATESYIENKISAVKNVVFDMLRSQDFDVDRITIE